MARAVVLREHGDADVQAGEAIELGAPEPGQLRLRQTVLGVNFHDIHVRSGLYKTLNLQGIPDIRGVGAVGAIGPGVEGVAPGDRVGYIGGGHGRYASDRLLESGKATRAIISRS